MGNTATTIESRAELQELARKILSIDCQVLDIGNRQGSTGYIDFITQSELTRSIAKGFDLNGRGFIAWKAECVLTSYDETSEFSTFTTFFKRYAETESMLYHTCGHDGQNLFSTEGGCSEAQMKFLLKLLETKEVTLNKEQIEAYRIIFQSWSFNLSDNATLKVTIPNN